MSSEAWAGVRNVVVTGSSAGIGQAIALALLDESWNVWGLDLAAPSISHRAFKHVHVDLAQDAELAQALSLLPPAQALVHAAGVLRVGALGSLNQTAGELMWRLHVRAAEQLADSLVPGMRLRRDGRVIFIGSRVAQGMPGRSQYAATKAALLALARSWAAEVAADGVSVNVISPAATQTAMLQDPARAGSTPRMPPIGRLIQPAEVAALTVYLLSPQAGVVTGQDIAICGGASLLS